MPPGLLVAPEIIVSHPGTDFDGLASMVAAQKLHPTALPVTQGRMDSNVKEFLSLYGDLFKFARAKDVDLAQVSHLITVDINRPARLGTLQEIAAREGMRITVYDHHPLEQTQREFGEAATIVHRSYGSGTSALVEILREHHIPISPVEATLFALGIAEDTGHLQFSSTTPSDFYIMGYLHECGVQQDLVNRFLTIELDQTQKALFQRLSLNVQKIRIKGMEIAFATAKTREMVPEVAVITRRLLDLENVDALFCLVASEGKAIIVGRSRTPAVDCNQLLGFLGGGGHPGAAAATVLTEDLAGLVQDLVSLVREHASAAIIARDIMSAPVRTIDQDATVDDGYNLLLRSGHSGLVVTDEKDRLLGIISRKDLDKALSHNLGHAPVKGYMSRNVVFVGEDASLEELADQIINHNVGRLPVVFGGRVVGIVTRSDVMRALHATSESRDLPSGSRHQPEREEALNGLRGMPRELQTLIETAGTIADELQMPLYLVGGIVRDFLLGRRNTDLDLVVEGDAIQLARKLAERLGLKLEIHERFGTATCTLPDSWPGSTRKVDIATARVEWYEKPGALPEIEQGGTYDDALRRDFTLNALALKVSGSKREDYGTLFDHWNGIADLRAGLIRILHPLSFVDDPTRIFRAVRFATRYGFTIETETQGLLDRAVAEGRLTGITPQRVREEILLCCKEEFPGRPILMAHELGLFAALQPGWTPLLPPLEKDHLLQEHLDTWAIADGADQVATATLALFALFSTLPRQTLETLIEHFAFDNVTGALLLAVAYQGAEARRHLVGLLEGLDPESTPRPSAVHGILGHHPLSALIFFDLAWTDDERLRQLLRLEGLINRTVAPVITGKDLIEAGAKEGPGIGRALGVVKAALLDGLIEGREAELKLATEVLAAELRL